MWSSVSAMMAMLTQPQAMDEMTTHGSSLLEEEFLRLPSMDCGKPSLAAVIADDLAHDAAISPRASSPADSIPSMHNPCVPIASVALSFETAAAGQGQRQGQRQGQGQSRGGKRKPTQEPIDEVDDGEETEPDNEGEGEGEHEHGHGVGGKAALVESLAEDEDEEDDEEEEPEARPKRRSARARKSRSTKAAAHDELDDDSEIDAAMATDKRHGLSLLRVKLVDMAARLALTTEQSANLPSSDRKKVRNRQASCVSRLKKKITLVVLDIRVDDQQREIAHLRRALASRDAILERHNLTHLVPAQDRVIERSQAITPASLAAEMPEPAVVPVQPTPKRPRGRPRKHPRPEDMDPAETAAALPPKGLFPPAAATQASQAWDAPSLVSPSPAGSPRLTTVLTAPATPATPTVPLVPATPAIASSTLPRPFGANRQISVTNPVCLCRGEPEADMVTCTGCWDQFHPYCVGLFDKAATFVCSSCTSLGK